MSEALSLEERCSRLIKDVHALCLAHQRDPKEVNILAVSKGQSAEKIKALYALGQRDFGENYLGELLDKRTQLEAACPLIRWHYIGQIQSKKIKKLAMLECVHSVVSFEQANKLSDARKDLHKEPLPIFLQVNLAPEDGRMGLKIGDLDTVRQAIESLPGVKLVGLMTILPHPLQKQPALYFRELFGLKGKLPDLSMGMSGDYADAIAEGATYLRLGTLLFGARS